MHRTLALPALAAVAALVAAVPAAAVTDARDGADVQAAVADCVYDENDPAVRLWGPDRIDTANAISAETFPVFETADVVVLARSDTYPDALAGGPLAWLGGGPLLLTSPNSLDPRTRDEIFDVLQPEGQILVLGGPFAISPLVFDEVAALGFDTVRIGGIDRYETATLIAEFIEQHYIPSEGVFLATGTSFPDALVAGAHAARFDVPLLLTDGGRLPPSTAAWLGSRELNVFAYGPGPALAYPAADVLIAQTGDEFERSALAARELDGYWPAEGFALASGVNFPDGLAGGPHIACLNGALLLTRPDVLSAPAAAYLADNAGLMTGFVYGGPSAVSDAVRQAAIDAVI